MQYLYISLVCGEELDFFLWQILFGKEFAKVIVECRDQSVAMMRNLCCAMRREIETEA